jgi:phosphohistidine phosphatase
VAAVPPPNRQQPQPPLCKDFSARVLDTLGGESDITAMRRLMLLRHAKTERAEPGERDRDRKLMKRGRNDAPVIGAYMAHHDLVPDLALVSPATRAQETWALVAPCFAKAPKMAADDRIYNANTAQLADVVRETRAAKSLLLVGHNPSFYELAVQLIASGDAGLRDQLSDGLPTSGLVVIDLPIDAWSLLRPQMGRLERFVTPRLLAAATQ